MDIEESLARYETHLRALLEGSALHRFLLLAEAKSLGCFCEPGSRCHVDIILKILKEYGINHLSRQCVKVKYLRPKWNNLKDWISADNILCTRYGRVFLSKRIVYSYPESEWANPFRVKK